jgi:hypothetical protein
MQMALIPAPIALGMPRNPYDPFENIASDYLTVCFIDLNEKVRETVEALTPFVDRFEGIVVRGMSGLLVGPMTASLLKKPWCVIRKPGEGTHSDHKVIEGWHNFKTYIIIDDLIATGGTLKLIQQTLRDHARAFQEKWERGLPECVGFYLFSSPELTWRGTHSYNDKYFLFQEIPARPNATEQIFAAAGTR